jgi:hypothetical protein
MKFKVFRIRFIFDLRIVFIKNFLKMAPIRVRFSPGFLKEQDFPGSNLIRAYHMGKNQFFAEQIAPAGALLSGLQTPWSSLRGKFAPERSSRSTLEQMPPREILLLGETPG